MSVQREAEKCKISSSRVVKSELPVGWPFFVVFCRYMEYFKKLTSYPLLSYLGLQTDKVWAKSIFWPWPRFLWFLLTFTLNWAANLEDYNRILNEECKEELGWRSPFEIYYERKSNQLVKASLDCVDSDDNIVTTAPKKRELAGHMKKVKKIRRRAKRYSKKLDDRMVKSHKRRHKAETFKAKEYVLVRYRPQKGGKLTPKRRFVVKGTVAKKRKTNPDTYKVRFRPPNSSKHIEEWFLVEDIASIRKRHPGSTNKAQQKSNNFEKNCTYR